MLKKFNNVNFGDGFVLLKKVFSIFAKSNSNKGKSFMEHYHAAIIQTIQFRQYLRRLVLA